jgi:hypothetical protein
MLQIGVLVVDWLARETVGGVVGAYRLEGARIAQTRARAMLSPIRFPRQV